MHPFGTELLWWNGAIQVPDYQELGLLRLIKPYDRSREEYKSLPSNMVEDWAQFFPGLKDSGVIDFILLIDEEADIIELLSLLFDRKPYDPFDQFRLKFPLMPGFTNPLLIDVVGWLKSKNISEGVYNSTDPYTVSGTIRTSGKPILTLPVRGQ